MSNSIVKRSLAMLLSVFIVATVLFIGNSFTYYNDMPSTYFLSLAAKAGYRVRVTAITKGGYTLEKFADPADEQGKRVAEALDAKNAGKYDYVVLQEQLHLRLPKFQLSRRVREHKRARGRQALKILCFSCFFLSLF